MAHLTAGDITPIGYIQEETYGTTPTGAYTYYGDICEGGNITPTDNPNAYVNWRYGSRRYDPKDHIAQNTEAGFKDAIEARDVQGWQTIITNALGTATGLPSRTSIFGFYRGAEDQYALKYNGCKTNELKISADVPGGIIKFEEDVMASYRDEAVITFPSEPSASTVPAVQWMSGMIMDYSTPIYPQSFSITIKNNLGRADRYNVSLWKNQSRALVEGRQEIELEMTLWMEDFTALVAGMEAHYASSHIFSLTLGGGHEVSSIQHSLYLNCQYMADGNNTPLVQDKQLQTLRFRAYNMTVSS